MHDGGVVVELLPRTYATSTAAAETLIAMGAAHYVRRRGEGTKQGGQHKRRRESGGGEKTKKKKRKKKKKKKKKTGGDGEGGDGRSNSKAAMICYCSNCRGNQPLLEHTVRA